MGDSKFFNNQVGNTLFDQFKGIIEGMTALDQFHAVVGYFRSSGYFKIRNEFEQCSPPPKIQILIGINIDNVFRKHDKSLLFVGKTVQDEAYQQFRHDFIADVRDAGYSVDIEKGILLLADDLKSGHIELKIHPTRDLHAKFYLFLPHKHTPHSDGWVIMGSSNLSESGLGLTQPPKYELNVAMKDYDDVAYCKGEFDKLWQEGLPLTFEDIQQYTKQTHLGQTPTPYELYIKLLIDYFGDQIEDDYIPELPEGFKELKYQKDAVSQGYQMLCKYDGFFLADVVGLGKTVVAAMIAKRFIEENGMRDSRVLVIFPPALEKNWRDTLQQFKINKKADFISCGSLDKLFEGDAGRYPEEYDLVIVDEAHRFRGNGSAMYDSLQRICKTDRDRVGRVGGNKKKVMLISATPLNNRPEDLYNLLMLFQDKRQCSIDGIPNLQDYFAHKISRFKVLINSKDDNVDVNAVKELYDDIRTKVIDKVTVRRTRQNILNHQAYKKDLESQKIVFPAIEPPRGINYVLHESLKNLFEQTMNALTEELKYARYRAIEKLLPPYSDSYPNAENTSRSLAGIYRTHMVKRLESSFTAFRISLRNLKAATQGMVDMFAANKVIIQPDLKVKELQNKGFDLEKIIQLGIEKLGLSKSDFVYETTAFKEEFLAELKADITLIDKLIKEWEEVNEDPKMDQFVDNLNTQIMDTKENPSGKVVIFSESKDTVEYLDKELKQRLGRTDILSVAADDRKRLFETIQANFDANYSGKKRDDYKILIATDVLAEGINLHRANVIVNYDTPWNATRLIQRIGRVNRIGSDAKTIVNYLLYPSNEGNQQIKLSNNALAKLQGFHAAYGEDSQIYSKEEIVEQFELFNAQIRDDVDKSLELLTVARTFKANHPEWFERIKRLPIKSRTARSIQECGKNIKSNSSLIYIASSFKKEFFQIEGNALTDKGFMEVIDLFEASPHEQPIPLPDCHFMHITKAHELFQQQIALTDSNGNIGDNKEKDQITAAALKLLRRIQREHKNPKTQEQSSILLHYVERGTFVRLSRELAQLERKHRDKQLPSIDIETNINSLINHYHTKRPLQTAQQEETNPQVILSETFVNNEQ